jgi:hypothetical protein
MGYIALRLEGEGSSTLNPQDEKWGLSTWISVSGNDDEALAHGEIIATADELQTVLRSLSSEQFT